MAYVAVTVITLSPCAEREAHHIITTEGETITLVRCPEGVHTMAASKEKTILFCVAKDGSKVRQWPVAVFNDGKSAKAYATILRLAYRSNDIPAVQSLDTSVVLTEAGALLKDVKWSLKTLPYAPTPDLDDDSADVEEPAAA